MRSSDALNRWLDRLGPVRTLTSATDAWQQGYERAVDAVYSGRGEGILRDALLTDPNYSGLRAALDEADDDFHMSRPMAQFYLAMSPKMFKRALDSGPHPFAQPRGGATKGVIDAWFARLVSQGVAMGDRVFKRVRSPQTGRPYLVSDDGLVLGDVQVLPLNAHDTARALANGAQVRVMKLDEALAMPWAHPDARKPLARVRQAWLEQQLESALEKVARIHDAIAQARAQDLEATLPPAAPARRSTGRM